MDETALPCLPQESADCGRFLWAVAIVPVQEWILAGRRTRDLRAGSVFLSWAVAKLLGKLEDDLGGGGLDVLMPALPPGEIRRLRQRTFAEAYQESSYSLPNRAVGTVAGLERAHLESVFTSLQPELDRLWAELAQDSWRCLPQDERWFFKGIEGEVLSSPGPVQVVWLARPFSGTEGGVTPADLEGLDQDFTALKRARPAGVWAVGKPVRKCEQCGLRESVGPSCWTKWDQWREELRTLPSVQRGRLLDEKDCLCAVCLTKRLASYHLIRSPFPTTSDLASAAWREEVSRRFPSELEGFRAEAARVAREFDGDWTGLLYKRSREAVAQAGLSSRSDYAGELPGLETLERLSEELASQLGAAEAGEADPPALAPSEDGPVGRRPKPEPSSYLAAISFDGDDMGRIVRSDPRRVPPLLAGFARGLVDQRLVERYHARAVYLGGDEGLLLAPVDELLSLALSLRRHWVETVADEVSGHPPTISLGIAIFDRQKPLQDGIRETWDALHLAKTASVGKNAIGLSVLTGSGSQLSSVLQPSDLEWLRRAFDLVLEGRLSLGWPYDMASLFAEFDLEGGWKDREFLQAMRALARRLTMRRARTEEDGLAAWHDCLAGDDFLEAQVKARALDAVTLHWRSLGFLVRSSSFRGGHDE